MDIPWRVALLVVAGAFVVFLLAKLLPGARRTPKSSPALATAKARIRDAKSDRQRAEALCDAALAVIGQPFGTTRAAGYFLRAMRADATWPGSVERAAGAFAHRRARLFENMLWRRLAATPWNAAHAPVVRALLTSLAQTSKRSRGHVAQSEVLARILAGESLSVPKA